MLAAGLLAKKAVERGLHVDPAVKTSLAPGSRVVTDYLAQDRACKNISINLGSTLSVTAARPASAIRDRCIRRSRERSTNTIWSRLRFFREIEISKRACIRTSKRIFSCRRRWWWPSRWPAEFDIDLSHDPIGKDKDGKETFLRDLWPTFSEIRDAMQSALDAGDFSQTLSRFRRSKSEVERHSIEHRRSLSVG